MFPAKKLTWLKQPHKQHALLSSITRFVISGFKLLHALFLEVLPRIAAQSFEGHTGMPELESGGLGYNNLRLNF